MKIKIFLVIFLMLVSLIDLSEERRGGSRGRVTKPVKKITKPIRKISKKTKPFRKRPKVNTITVRPMRIRCYTCEDCHKEAGRIRICPEEYNACSALYVEGKLKKGCDILSPCQLRRDLQMQLDRKLAMEIKKYGRESGISRFNTTTIIDNNVTKIVDGNILNSGSNITLMGDPNISNNIDINRTINHENLTTNGDRNVTNISDNSRTISHENVTTDDHSETNNSDINETISDRNIITIDTSNDTAINTSNITINLLNITTIERNITKSSKGISDEYYAYLISDDRKYGTCCLGSYCNGQSLLNSSEKLDKSFYAFLISLYLGLARVFIAIP